jgi:hypothetical protein
MGVIMFIATLFNVKVVLMFTNSWCKPFSSSFWAQNENNSL